MGEVWFNVKTGEVFEQTIHKRMNKEKYAEGGWVLLFNKDHRHGPHGWAVDYAWCDRCQQYHYVYNSYNGEISNGDHLYIMLLDETHDCKIAKIVRETGIIRDTQYHDLKKILQILEVTSYNIDELKPFIKTFIRLPRRIRKKLLQQSKDEIMAYLLEIVLF